MCILPQNSKTQLKKKKRRKWNVPYYTLKNLCYSPKEWIKEDWIQVTLHLYFFHNLSNSFIWDFVYLV